MKYVRGSEVSSFLRCRKQWFYNWVKEIEPRRPDNKLFFGNLAHKFMEVYYRNLNQNHIPPAEMAMIAMKHLFQETDTSRMEQTELDELWELASKVMQNYVAQWKEQDSKWTILATELRFAIPLDEDTMYEGTIDLVYLDEHEDLYFKDHKNVGSIERYVGMAEMDRQISRYWWALQQLARGNGYVWDQGGQEWLHVRMNEGQVLKRVFPFDVTQLKEPTGFTYNLILKDFPTVPKLLKPTKANPVALSKAKDQKTTYAVYMQALEDNGITIDVSKFTVEDAVSIPNEYVEILDHLLAQETERGNRFFRRVPVVRNEAEVQAAMQEFLAVVADVNHVKIVIEEPLIGIHDPTYRNINADCSWCNYKALCVAEMNGDNAEFVRNTLYKTKETTLVTREDEAE